jgi:hypothetical protein
MIVIEPAAIPKRKYKEMVPAVEAKELVKTDS